MVSPSQPIKGDIGKFQLLFKDDKRVWFFFQKCVLDRLNMLEDDPTLLFTGTVLSGCGERKETGGE